MRTSFGTAACPLKEALKGSTLVRRDRIVGMLAGLANGLEMSRPASAWIVPRKAYVAAGRVGASELLGGAWACWGPRISPLDRKL